MSYTSSKRYGPNYVNNTRYRLLFVIMVILGMQQFPILNIGVNIKLYEILGIILLFTYKSIRPKRNIAYIGFLILFVISPIASLIHFLISVDIPESFYAKYPDAMNSLKYSRGSIFPILILIYMFYNYAVVCGLYHEGKIFYRFNKLVKWIVYIGTLIAVYSIFSVVIGKDLVTYLPSIIQEKRNYINRTTGFCAEAGSYAFYQTWVTLFCFFGKKNFKPTKWRIMMVINTVSLILSVSSTLAALAIAILISPLIFRIQSKKKLYFVLCILIFSVLGFFFLEESGYFNFFYYSFVDKIGNFMSSGPNYQTLDSAGMRRYTSELGMYIFQDHPIFGVGCGNAPYFMDLYDWKTHVIYYGEILSMTSFPQSLYPCVLAEQGIAGGIGLTLIFLGVLKTFWKYRNLDQYTHMFFIGSIYNVAVMFSFSTPYSLYYWAYLALGMGYINYKKSLLSR